MIQTVTKAIDAASDLDEAARVTAAILRQGGVIGYPTETVYGLGCDAFIPDAVRRIAELKGREENKPFLVLLPDAKAISSIAGEMSGTIKILTDAFWPGPLTLLIPHRNQFTKDLTMEGSIGVRVSSDPFCRALAVCYDHPIVSTSANPAGLTPARSREEVIRYFDHRIDAVVDVGMRQVIQPSTILDVSVNPPRLIRDGAIPSEMIEQHLRRSIER